MVYRIGQRVRPKANKLKFLSLSLSVGLVGAMITIAYADPLINKTNSYPLPHQIYTAAAINKSLKSIRTGSAAPPPASVVNNSPTPSPLALVNDSCTGLFGSPIAGLSSAVAPELRKLAQYDQLCNGNPVQRDSFFVPTPTTTVAAASDANDVAVKLIEYASFGIKPLVFIEPDTDDGTNIDLNLYQAGDYDAALNAYFADLQGDGVTDAMMGMWVVLPEGNLPVWTSVDPATYTADVIKTIDFQKQYFPTSQSALLLSSETYPSVSSWSGGQYVSLLPYVENIPKGLVNSFGLEGFPWSPAANQSGSSLDDPSVYLPANLAAQAASSLGISDVWFNTGTFNQMYAQNPNEIVTTQPAQRQAELNGVLTQAKILQSDGYDVAIHLFAQNKANTTEGTDWSYWNSVPGDEAGTSVLTTFIGQTAEANIPLWLFDTYDQ